MSYDLNYTLLENALTIGGVVRRSVDLDTGEIISPENCYSDSEQKIGFEKCYSDEEKKEIAEGSRAGVPAGRVRGVSASPLSKSHIRPRGRKMAENEPKMPSYTWRQGASFFKVSQGSDGNQVGGGKRKKIKGFSANSRRGLMFTISGIRRDADLPCFVTLTYPNKFPSPKDSKRHLKMFIQRLLRAFSDCSGIWKLEPQERGAPHYHILVWGVDEIELKKFIPYAWHDIAGDGDRNHLFFHLGLLDKSRPCVSLVRSFRGVWSYASKYLGKTFSVAGWDDLYTGRFWGYIKKEKIPFGALCTNEINSRRGFHLMRYQRRFSGRRVSSRGFTLFCDADQWIKNISSEV